MKPVNFLRNLASASVLAVAASSAVAAPIQVEVNVTSNVPGGGVAITPVWVGFHNGSFDSYDGGSPAASALESLAELGITRGFGDNWLKYIGMKAWVAGNLATGMTGAVVGLVVF